MPKSRRILHTSFSRKSHTVLAETPKEGLDCSFLVPACSLTPALSTLQERSWWQQSQPSRQKGASCAPSPHHKALKWVSTQQGLAGGVFYIASEFALALHPSAKPLLTKKSLASQGHTVVPFFFL